ncbi:hypothetical protein [Propylenella binzhouense]|uniref:DUF8173 domain-containing protein n=1 Tax=Propylenella binzhouense TaxID=2555902 RepID=A0A964T2U5_9HYPH|nr:hypothetical protein [Propylenella binzhouense]MYZ47215.1 hypothetical protein [Propylenella binzhouense]
MDKPHALLRRAIGFAIAAMLVFGASAAPAQSDMPGPEENRARSGQVLDFDPQGGDASVTAASVAITGRARDVRAAGALVSVRGEVERSVRVAGAKVSVAGAIGRALRAAGATIDVTARIGGDASLAGAVVTASVATGGNLRAAGATVTVAPGTDVGGSLWVGGVVVEVAGHVARNASLMAGTATITGRIDGDLILSTRRTVLAPGAIVSGDIVVQAGPEPEIRPGAQVAGTVRVAEPHGWRRLPPWARRIGFAALLAGSVLLSGLALMLFANGTAKQAAAAVRARPLASLGAGIATLVLLPILGAILMATIVGLPVGFGVLLLLPFLLAGGLAAAAIAIGGSSFGDGIGAGGAVLRLVLGALILALLSLVPVAGGWLVAIALVFGTGALVLAAKRRLRPTAAIEARA